AGAQCTVSVTFTPSAPPTLNEVATLVFTGSDVNSPQNVSLSGSGSPSAPGVGLAPTTLAFGNQFINTTSAAQTVTLTNTGNAALTISSIAASGDFAETSTAATATPIIPTTRAAVSSRMISKTNTPTVAGARTGTLTVTDNADGLSLPVTLPISPSAPGVGLAPTTLAFGNQFINTTSAAQTVTLTNTGNAALTINSIAASGDFAETS